MREGKSQSEKDRLAEIEKEIEKPDFWQNKERAQRIIKEFNELKEKLKENNKYDKGDAVMNIFSGAGGDDAEDWASIILRMYQRFAEKKKWDFKILHIHSNETGGIKNATVEILGENVYGLLKGESGVHRLVRISPFSAKKLRHTSFVLVEVLPRIVKPEEVELKNEDLRVDFSRSGGPGGQNVNKRETAIRITHIPSGIQVHVDSGRSQQQNKEKALEILRSKIYKMRLSQQKKEEENMKISKTTEAEWGRQIRSYVFHPYKMVKDHRTNVETSDINSILEGDLDEFIEAERK
jgi:peptide chain release factor 2